MVDLIEPSNTDMASVPDSVRNYIRGLEEAMENYSRLEHSFHVLKDMLANSQARYNSVLQKLVAITGFLKPENIKTPDGKEYEFNPSDEMVRLYWNGLTEAIRKATVFDTPQFPPKDWSEKP